MVSRNGWVAQEEAFTKVRLILKNRVARSGKRVVRKLLCDQGTELSEFKAFNFYN
jgi:hypothetical protein